MKSTERELTMRYAELLEKEMFDDIVVFSVSEPGAMGPGGVMTFYKKMGSVFRWITYPKQPPMQV